MSRSEIGSWRTKKWRYSLIMGEQEAKTFGRQLYSQAEQQTLLDIQGTDGQWAMVFAMPLLHRMTAESKCS